MYVRYLTISYTIFHILLGLKLKDATKALGKKFASGASVNESATGTKEVVIQGDVGMDLPPFLVTEFNVPTDAIFMLEDGKLVSCT